jgi:hypothetical protein
MLRDGDVSTAIATNQARVHKCLIITIKKTIILHLNGNYYMEMVEKTISMAVADG